MLPPLTVLCWLLTAVATATAAMTETRLSCNCQLRGVNYQQVDIKCGTGKATTDVNTASSDITCEKETVGRVPSGYRYFPGIPALYKLFATSANYQTAEQVCIRDGGHLAVPRDQHQAEVIAEILKDGRVIKEAFVGVNNIGTNGSFVTVTGERALYRPFAAGQPDNKGEDENCCLIDRHGEYSDIRCELVFPFVCQRDLDPPPPEGYSYLPGLGFYRLWTTPAVYEAAKQRCSLDGGHVAVADTEEEAEQLLWLLHNTSFPEAFVGLSDAVEEGHFVTETGKPEETLLFRNWFPGEPNNKNNEDCVTLRRSGTFNDVDCEDPFLFFCELPLPS